MNSIPESHSAAELPDTVPACHALIGELLQAQLVMLQRLAELEERLKLDSRNSSKPPSSDGPGSATDSRSGKAKSERKRGAQSGHQGHYRAQQPAEQVDHLVDCLPPSICACGGALHPHGQPLRHQVFELPTIQPIVTEYRRHGAICADCGQHTLAKLPAGVSTGQLGARAVALIGTLAGQFHLSQHKIKTLLAEVFGLKFSIGTVSAAHGKVADALAPVCREMQEAIRQAPVKHADETSHQSHGQRMWLWAAVTDWGAYFQISPSRGQLAAKALLGEELQGLLVSDRYVGYNWVNLAQRQVCWSHLLRDFARIGGRDGLAGVLGRSLLGMGLLMFRYRHRGAKAEQFAPLQARIKRILERGAAQTACDRTAKTCQNLLKLWPALWRFLRDPQIEPTNNRAERAIRGVVLRRKISYVTRSGRGMRFVERTFAAVYSCRQQSRNFFDFLGHCVSAAFAGTPTPSLVPQAA